MLPSMRLTKQVRGSSVISSGIQLIPYTVVIAISSILAGEISTRTHIIRPLIWVGFGITSLGFGLLYAYFTPDVTIATQSGLLALTSFGVGLSITTPILVIQAAMPPEDMAAATSAWLLVRSFSATIGEYPWIFMPDGVGVAVFTAVLNDGLRSRFEAIEGYGKLFEVPTDTAGYHAIHDLPEGPIRQAVLTAFANSFRVSLVFNRAHAQTCWIIGCCLLAFSLIVCGPACFGS